MALNALGMGFVFTAKDLATGVIKKVKNEYISAFQTAQQGAAAWRKVTGTMAAGGTAVATGMMALAGGGALADVAGEFEQTITAVGMITDATAAQMNELTQAAYDAARATQFSPLETALGLQELGSAGLNATGAMNALTPVLQLASASLGQISVPESAEAVVSVLNSFGMEAKNANVIVDQLVTAANKSNLQFRDMRLALANASAAAKKANQSFETTLSLLGAVRNTGKDASSTATAVREALNRLSMPQAQKHLTNLIGEDGWIDKQKGQVKDFVEIFKSVDKALSKMSPKDHAKKMEVLYRIYGTKGDSLYNALKNFRYEVVNSVGAVEKVLTGIEGFEEFRRQHSAGAAEGAAQRYMDKLLDTFKGQRDRLRNAGQIFATAIGDIFAKTWKPVVKVVVNALLAVSHVFTSMSDGVKRFVGWFITISSVTLIVAGGLTMLLAILPVLKAGFVVLGLSLGGFLAALWPIAKALAVVGLAVAGLYLAFKNNLGGVADSFSTTVEKISLSWQALEQMFTKGFVDGDVAEKLLGGDESFLTYLVTIYNALNRVGHFFSSVWEGIMEYMRTDGAGALQPFVDGLAMLSEGTQIMFDTWKDVTNALSPSSIGEIGNSLGQGLGKTFAFLAGLVGLVFELIGAIWYGLSAGYAAFVKPALDGLAENFGVFLNLLGETLENLGLFSSEGSTLSSIFKAIGLGTGIILGFALGAVIKIISAVFSIANTLMGFISEFARMIGGVVNLIVGLFEIVFGIFTGNTDMIGQGFRKMILGISKVFVGLVGVLLQGLGMIGDMFWGVVNSAIKIANKIPGVNIDTVGFEGTGWASGVTDGLEKSIANSLNIGKPAVAAAQASTPGVDASASMSSMMSEPPPVNVEVNASFESRLDSKQLYSSMEQVSSDEEHELRGNNLSFSWGF